MSDLKNFLKTTTTWIKNHGELIFDESCVHFSWDVKKKNARNLLKQSNGQYECSCCGFICDKKVNNKIEKLVTYINAGGRDDKKLDKLFNGIEIVEWGVIAPGRVVENGAYGSMSSSCLEHSFGLKKRIDLE